MHKTYGFLGVEATTLGRIASYYYLSHRTVQHFAQNISSAMKIEDVLKVRWITLLIYFATRFFHFFFCLWGHVKISTPLQVLSDCSEYDELPVRHNEDMLNEDLAKFCPIKVNQYTFDSSNTKTHLLFQSHFSRNQLPSTDYLTDTKSVLDQAIRIIQVWTVMTWWIMIEIQKLYYHLRSTLFARICSGHDRCLCGFWLAVLHAANADPAPDGCAGTMESWQ